MRFCMPPPTLLECFLASDVSQTTFSLCTNAPSLTSKVNNALASDAPEWELCKRRKIHREQHRHYCGTSLPARHFMLSFSHCFSRAPSDCFSSSVLLWAFSRRFQFCFDRCRERLRERKEQTLSRISCCAKSRINNYFLLWIHNSLRSTTVDFGSGDAFNARLVFRCLLKRWWNKLICLMHLWIVKTEELKKSEEVKENSVKLLNWIKFLVQLKRQPKNWIIGDGGAEEILVRWSESPVKTLLL